MQSAGELNNHVLSRNKCHTRRRHITVVFSCYSAAVKNPENADLKQHPSPLHSHSEPRLPQQPMNWEVDNHASSHFQRQQQPTTLQIPPHFTTGWQMPSKPHNSKDSYVELPQELISFFRIVKSLL